MTTNYGLFEGSILFALWVTYENPTIYASILLVLPLSIASTGDRILEQIFSLRWWFAGPFKCLL